MISRLLLLLAGLALTAPGLTAAAAPDSGPTRVRVTTNVGAFVIELETERAPLTVENFLRYVREGHYSGTVFHRVIEGFVAQGGGLDTSYELKPVHEKIPNESGNGLLNRRGTVGLARAAGPHTGDSQFYVNLADNPELNPLPTRWGYAVFGRVVEGMNVVEGIGFSRTGPQGPLASDAPLKQIVIEKAEVIGETAAPAAATKTPPAAATEAPPAP